ncbi:hypothetical protein LCGC14_0396440 [marine sediment metagenome]|uniref:Uncharacterized protein n=1 Tax=marine sediment metagenome TaxID=412755 RepID=A0A0F9TG49_9ZZZZ
MFKILPDKRLLEVVSSIPQDIKPDISVTIFLQSECQAVAKAEQKNTLKQVIEWGNEKCKHSNYLMKKKGCPYCWQELIKEVDSG